MTPSSLSHRTIELEIILTATPAEIWNALSSGEGLRQWFPPIAQGGDKLGAELLHLEHHAGSTRVAINERRLATIPRPQLWTQLLGDSGLRATHSGTKGVRVGDKLAFTMTDGRSIPFVVGRVEPSILWGTLKSLNDGLLMIELEPGVGEYHFGIYLSVYRLPRRDVDALRTWCRTVADRSLASEAAR